MMTGEPRFRGFDHAAFDVVLVGISRLMGPFFSRYALVPTGEPYLARSSFSGYATVYRLCSVGRQRKCDWRHSFATDLRVEYHAL